MTEPVLRSATNPVRPVRGLARSMCAGLVASTLGLTSALVHAAPAQGPTAEGPAEPAAAELPDEAEIRAALDDGDLTRASELAAARSAADPSVDNLALEAEVWLALADYERAKAALDRAIAAVPETAADDRAALVALRDEVEAASRGTRADEPASTHREDLDQQRADRLAALAPKPAPAPEPVDEPAPREPIVKKWYFWVTLGAIVATAGAIVGVAVASSIDERKGDAVGGTAASQPAPGGLTIRF